MPQPRKRLILRGSSPHSRLGHTSDIHSQSYSWFGMVCTPAGMVYTFSFSFVLVCLVIMDPVRQGDAQLSHPLSQVSAVPVTVWCSGLAILSVVIYLIVWWFALIHARTTTVHTMLETSICVTSWPALLVDYRPSVHLGGSWMCLLSYCWQHHRVELCCNVDGGKILCHWCIESLYN